MAFEDQICGSRIQYWTLRLYKNADDDFILELSLLLELILIELNMADSVRHTWEINLGPERQRCDDWVGLSFEYKEYFFNQGCNDAVDVVERGCTGGSVTITHIQQTEEELEDCEIETVTFASKPDCYYPQVCSCGITPVAVKATFEGMVWTSHFGGINPGCNDCGAEPYPRDETYLLQYDASFIDPLGQLFGFGPPCYIYKFSPGPSSSNCFADPCSPWYLSFVMHGQSCSDENTGVLYLRTVCSFYWWVFDLKSPKVCPPFKNCCWDGETDNFYAEAEFDIQCKPYPGLAYPRVSTGTIKMEAICL